MNQFLNGFNPTVIYKQEEGEKYSQPLLTSESQNIAIELIASN